jgi:hypothetical protein
MMSPRILCVLQNQWFKEPQKAEAMYARHPDVDEKLGLNKTLLFGSPTGQTIRRVFGEDLAEGMFFINASPQIGGFAASHFKADLNHISFMIEHVRPEIIIAFGVQARLGVGKVWSGKTIFCDHPASHNRKKTTLSLLNAQRLLEEMILQCGMSHK